jgi:drug/metabolite transporter (DMT)-like permease
VAIQGELVALLTAFLWAMSSVAYQYLGQRTPPLLLNLYKASIAIGFLVVTILVLRSPWPIVPLYTFGLLFLSGAIGIGLGDTAYFAALNRIGARQTLLIRVLAPAIAAMGSALFLGEQLSYWAWGGISITLAGVAWVISEGTPAASWESVDRQMLDREIRGGLFALIAALTDGLGAVLSRAALAQTTIEPLWSALLRLVGGAIVVLVLMVGQRKPLMMPSAKQTWQLVQVVLGVAFFSTYLGIWLQQTALKLTTAGVAQTLGATSPLFVLPIVAWQGERIGWKAIGGVVVALVGVGILLLLR